MTGPLFTDADVADLRQQSTAGMRHTARQVTTTRTTLPNEEIAETPGLGPPICCHYSQGLTPAQAQVAASLGIIATGRLKVPGGTTIEAGQVWEVQGEDGCWTEAVKVKGDLVKHGRIMRLVAVDTQLNR